MLKGFYSALENTTRLKKIADEKKKNYEWILENKEEIINSFPNCWIIVDNQITGIADYSLDYIMKIMKNQESVSPSALYVFGDVYHFHIVSSYDGEN